MNIEQVRRTIRLKIANIVQLQLAHKINPDDRVVQEIRKGKSGNRLTQASFDYADALVSAYHDHKDVPDALANDPRLAGARKKLQPLMEKIVEGNSVGMPELQTLAKQEGIRIFTQFDDKFFDYLRDKNVMGIAELSQPTPTPYDILKLVIRKARGQFVYGIEMDLWGNRKLSNPDVLDMEIDAGASPDPLVQKCFDFVDAVLNKALKPDTPKIDKAITTAKNQLLAEIDIHSPNLVKTAKYSEYLDGQKISITSLVMDHRAYLRSKGQDFPGIG